MTLHTYTNRTEVIAIMTTHKRGTSIFSLVFCPMFLLVTTQHPLRFVHTTAFIFLTACFMILPFFTPTGAIKFNLFFSGQAQAMLVAASVLNSSLAWSAERISRHRYLSSCALQ